MPQLMATMPGRPPPRPPNLTDREIFDYLDILNGLIHQLWLRADGEVRFVTSNMPVEDSGWHGKLSRLQHGSLNASVLFRFHGHEPMRHLIMSENNAPWGRFIIMTGVVNQKRRVALVFRGLGAWGTVNNVMVHPDPNSRL